MEVPYVYGDQEQGGYLAMRHLIELGHRRIAYCEIDWGHLGLRGAGHQRALKEWNSNPRGVVGLRSRLGERSAPDTSLVRTSEIPIETIRQWAETPRLAAEFFQAPDAPTALLAWNDHQALRFLRILLCAGVRVPEQVSLIGYDALPESRLFYPSLTTLSTQVEQQIQIAVNLLTRPKPVPATHSVVLVPSLVPGESTARI
jgi:DNA-binding LacI/PurR family transcriptional regulator